MVFVLFVSIPFRYWQAAHSNEDVASSGAMGEPKPAATGTGAGTAAGSASASSASEAKAEEKETKEKQRKAAAASGGWLPEILTGIFKKPKNQMKLPDDKNPTVMEEEEKRTRKEFPRILAEILIEACELHNRP